MRRNTRIERTQSELLHKLKYLSLTIALICISSANGIAQGGDILNPHSLGNAKSTPRMCCPENSYYLTDSGSCSSHVNGSINFDPPYINQDSTEDASWVYHGLECPRGYFAKNFDVSNTSNINHLSLIDGTLYLNYAELIMKKTSEFCVGFHSSGDYIGVTCRPNVTEICSDVTCVQKCCDEGEALYLSQGKCLPNAATNNFTPKFQSISGIEASAPADLQVLHSIPECDNLLFANPKEEPEDHFFLTTKGVLYQPGLDDIFQKGMFCLDYFDLGDAELFLAAFTCHGPPLSTEIKVKHYIYAICLLISVISILITILFSTLIKELRAMLDRNQLCHMGSLLAGELALFVGYLFSNDIHKIHCVVNGFITQFSLLSAFFWLNVMCIDIHQYIRATVKCIPRLVIQNSITKRFIGYSVYAWGCPLILTVVTAILHNLPDDPDSVILKPGFGTLTCWMNGDWERLTFFYVWVGTLFLANVCLLGNTAFMLYKSGVIFQSGKKSTLEQGDNRATNRGHFEKFWQSFCLFSLMAICWVTEVLSWKIPPEFIWIPTDIINSLQGFFIFIFFIRVEKKKEIVKKTLTRIFFRISETARKLSTSDYSSGGPFWHFNKSEETNISEIDGNQSQEPVEEKEQELQQITPAADLSP